jgi:hypothetical protein
MFRGQFFFTGKRMFAGVVQIDFWDSAERARIWTCFNADDCGALTSVQLDESETEIVRGWNQIALQMATNEAEGSLIDSRFERAKSVRRAERLNRTRRKAGVITADAVPVPA